MTFCELNGNKINKEQINWIENIYYDTNDGDYIIHFISGEKIEIKLTHTEFDNI